MPNIFEYTDFRRYLADYYTDQKSKNANFSYKLFANKAGFKNKGFVFNIINGAKNLSKSSIYKISQAIKHNKYEAEYFENLVAMNQAKSHGEREHFYQKLESVRNLGRPMRCAQLVRKDQYEFYSKWYHSAIRSIIDMYAFKNDYTWLAKNVYPKITPKEAKKSIRLLKKIGLIEKQKNGVYKVANKTITTGKEILGLAIAKFHLETLALASHAINELPREERNISGLTLGISRKMYEKICERIQEFQGEILEMAEKDSEADSVYQFDFNLFPLSNTEIKKGEKND